MNNLNAIFGVRCALVVGYLLYPHVIIDSQVLLLRLANNSELKLLTFHQTKLFSDLFMKISFESRFN